MAVVLMSIRNIKDEKSCKEMESENLSSNNLSSHNKNIYPQICNENIIKAQKEFEIILKQCKKIMDITK